MCRRPASLSLLIVLAFIAGAVASMRVGAEDDQAEPEPALTFAWFSELNAEHSYWKQNFAFAQAAADDLGVRLLPHHVESDQVLYRELLGRVVGAGADQSGAADGVIFLNIKGQNAALLEIIERGSVPAISNVLTMDYETVGEPRDRYSKWLAEFYDDEERNGFEVARHLFEAAADTRTPRLGRTIHAIAIHGKKADSASIGRREGLNQALDEHPHVQIEQEFYATNWSRSEGKRFVEVSLRRYPNLSVIWCANDDVLLGALEAIEERGLLPGDDVYLGGIDGTVEVARRVADGSVVCTVAGLTFHSGWALVLLHDYLRGTDFANDTGVLVRNSNTIITQDNAATYLEVFGDGDWSSIDFRQYSKVLNPDLVRYDFSVDLESLAEAHR